jgi:tight adherence protein B
MTTVLVILICAAATVVLFSYGLYGMLTRRKAILANRLEAYTSIEEEAALATEAELRKLSAVPRILHLLLGRGYMQKLQAALLQADIPMRPTEYVLLRLLLAALGLLIGLSVLGYLHSGIILAVAGFFVPPLVVRAHQNRRRARFVTQLADALMLLTNSLRAGYGFIKGLELVAKEMSDPIAKELNRMLREISLGATVEEALLNLGRRVNSPDLDIVISAYLVQKDVGGNLTEIMEKVAETIRERLRIQGDIRVLTVQGRMSGLIVGLLPFVVGLFLLMKAPDYFKQMFGPPLVSVFGAWELPLGAVMLAVALVLQLFGAYSIYKIVSIKV